MHTSIKIITHFPDIFRSSRIPGSQVKIINYAFVLNILCKLIYGAELFHVGESKYSMFISKYLKFCSEICWNENHSVYCIWNDSQLLTKIKSSLKIDSCNFCQLKIERNSFLLLLEAKVWWKNVFFFRESWALLVPYN